MRKWRIEDSEELYTLRVGVLRTLVLMTQVMLLLHRGEME